MNVKTDEAIPALTCQHAAHLHEKADSRKRKSARDPACLWHYLTHFDPADTETGVYGQSSRYCDSSTEDKYRAPEGPQLPETELPQDGE